MNEQLINDNKLEFIQVNTGDQFPEWACWDEIVMYFHNTMKPYEDLPEDVERALHYAFTPGKGQGGFLELVRLKGKLAGACLMLQTGMKGYIPEWVLLMIAVDPDFRGRGIGGKLIGQCLEQVDGDVKLHVEYDNPAKKLYERNGFTSKYAEMRYSK